LSEHKEKIQCVLIIVIDIIIIVEDAVTQIIGATIIAIDVIVLIAAKILSPIVVLVGYVDQL